MTPNQIIKFGTERHQILLYDDPEQIESLMRYTLTRYESKASVLNSVYIEELTNEELWLDKPEDFKSLVYAEDDRGIFQPSRLRARDSVERIFVQKDNKTILPVKVHYFVSLSGIDLDAELPRGVSVSLVMDHFFTMLDRENSKELRNSSAVTGIQDSSESDETLTQRIMNLETLFEGEQAILPPITVR